MVIKKRNILDKIVLASIIFFISISLVSGLLVNQNPCCQCHGNISESCRLNPSSTSAVLPATIPKGLVSVTIPVEVSGSGSNSFYRISTLKVTLSSVNGKITIQNPSQEWTNLYPGGKIFFTSTISGVQEGTDTLLFNLTASNSHHAVIFTDSYGYEVSISKNGSATQQPAVEPSTRSFYLSRRHTTMQLLVIRDIQNLVITSSKNITVRPTLIASAQSGDVIDIDITVLGNTTLQDSFSIAWNETTESQHIDISLSFVPPTPEDINYYSVAGRTIGILSFMLLIASICLSGINKRIRKRVKSIIEPKRRMQIHCYFSWALLAISLLHGILLLLGPYTDFLVKPEVILGYFTLLSMTVVSINGSFRTPIIKIIGASLWRKTHGYYSYIALLLCIIHAILIGTEFEIIRGLF